jgi:hypothetical protein
MTALIARILADGGRRGEVSLDDLEAAAGVVRDAITVFVHPVHVATAVAAGLPSEYELTVAASTDFMHLFGLVALGYMWARSSRPHMKRSRRAISRPT